MAWSSGNLGVTAAVLCLFTTMSGAIQLDDCKSDGYIYITNDTSSPSTITCSGLAKDASVSVTWFIGTDSQITGVADCSGAKCNQNSPDVTAVQYVNSGLTILTITQNHQQVAGGDAKVRCQSSTDNADCKIRIIDRLPSIVVYGAEHPLYVGEQADLRCGVSPTESLPSIHITYTWKWSGGAAVSCIDDTVPGVCQFYLEPHHNKAGVNCYIAYTGYSNIPGKSTTVILKVRYPPPQAPVITGNREVSVGESLTLECRVYSGNPLVSVNFFCGQGRDDFDTTVTSSTDDTSYVSSSVTIQSVQTSDNGVTCECRGNWEKPELYTNRSSVTLTVSGAGTSFTPVTSAGTAGTATPSVPTNTGELSGSPTNVNAGAIAGGVIAAIVVIAIVVVVLVFIIKRRNSRPKPPPAPTRDPEYDTEEHINPVYGTEDPSTSSSPRNDIYGSGGAADDEIPDIGYSEVGNGAQAQIPLDTQYAVVDKSRKNQPPAGTKQPQDEYSVLDKSRKNQPPAPSHDEYAVVDKSRKNQPPAPTQDEYAVVDKTKKKPAAKPKPGAKPKACAAATPTDDEYNSLSFQQSSHAPQQSRYVEQDCSHLADVRSDADR